MIKYPENVVFLVDQLIEEYTTKKGNAPKHIVMSSPYYTVFCLELNEPVAARGVVITGYKDAQIVHLKRDDLYIVVG